LRKVFYFSCFIVVVAITLIYFDFIEIKIGHSKKELNSDVQIKNNSVTETLKYFSKNENEQLLHSKILFLNFWSPRCGACKREKPNLYKIQNKFKNEDIQFLSYRPPSLFEFSTHSNTLEDTNFNYTAIDFNEGVKRSILKIAGNNGLNVDTTLQSFPNTVIISTSKDSILYFTQSMIQNSDLSKIYMILQKELDDSISKLVSNNPNTNSVSMQ
jgi:thiol-disulfide isomerase/thioredoxin